ncbi:MAG: ribonuclease D [Rhodobiaceae bacterium]|nr:ribonuclease D [Rhodobiaceae bacterium]MCC0014989.1 ribonuclease D [Rhodobiaceae bacterium]MCC0053003.1 ribonuclease D [Rhodobiaceae bacterium]
MINTTRALQDACQSLAGNRFITIDTEFLRDTTFWPKLCLIQMASPQGDLCLVDPLAEGLDLAPFFELMRNEAVLKVFHAARQDIEIIFNLSGSVPHPVFDTQVAAAVCGFGESVSYDQLVRRVKKTDIDKSHRFTDWSRRPLSDKQLRYAAADVIHLIEPYLFLEAELEERNRSHWIAEEMELLTSPETYRLPPEEAWTRLKLRARKPREFAVLKDLAEWREREAQTRDVPRGRIIKDDVIYEIAAQQPDTAQALGHVRALPRGFERSRSGEAIIALVRAVKERDENDLPRLPRGERRPQAHPAVVDMLKVLLKQVCEDEGVAPRMIATSDDIELLAGDNDAEIAALQGWRREIFGDLALRLKRGELGLAVRGSKLLRIELEPAAEAAGSSRRR